MIPHPAPSLVGRSEEQRTLLEAVRGGSVRLAVVGPGGSGKSRLVAETLPGALLCTVGSCRDRADLLEALGNALGVPLIGDDDAERLGQLLLRDGRVVVLDGTERVQAAVLDVCATWPPAVPCVTTTRIRPPGWAILDLGPLGLPAADTLEAVLASPAGALFVQRGRQARAGWTPQDAEGPVIAEVLRRLDGLPLALELAAARLRSLGTRQLRDHLDERFGLLKNHETSLRAVLESSLALLDPPDRALLAQLAGFHGGFDLAAVEAMDGVSGPIDAIDRIDALVAHSLVRSWELPRLPGKRWYGLYDSVRELVAPDAPAHGPWLAAYGLQLAREAYGPDPLPACETLAVYAPDLRQTFEAAVTTADSETAGRAALALDALYKARGPGSARGPVLSRARALGGEHHDELTLAGMDARVFPPDPTELARIAADGPARIRAWALRNLAREHASSGATGQAWDEANAAVALEPGEPRNRVALAEVYAARGERVEAVRAYHQALAAAEASGARRDEASVLGFLAMSEHDLGNGEEARALGTRAIERLDALDEPRRAAVLAQLLGEVALDMGDLAEADRAFGAAQARLEAVGEARWQSYCIAGRALVKALQGDPGAARAGFRQALIEARMHDSLRQQGVIACWAATAAARNGRVADAEALLAEVTDDAPKLRQGRQIAAIAIDVARAAELRERDPAGAAALESGARARLDGLDRSLWSSEVRVVARWVDQAVAGLEGRTVDLRLGPELAWFEVPTGSRRSLVKHHANRRVLACLVDAHRAAPGAAVTVAELLKAGWPDELVLPDAGAARVYTALSTLRRWGLRAVLEKAETGYRIRADAVVEP
ncbi:MAG: hypothetical protein R3F61_13910 [Myxococcota bacterium]